MRISDWSSDVCSSDLIDFSAIAHDCSSSVSSLAGQRAGAVPAALPGAVTPWRRLDRSARTDAAHRAHGSGSSATDARAAADLRPAHDHRRVALDTYGNGMNILQCHTVFLLRQRPIRSEEHTSELHSLIRTSYA